MNANCVRHWKREGADVYIGRPGPWGNPFAMNGEDDRENVIARYRTWLDSQPHLKRMARRELAGKTLGCWCAPASCHGDVLAAVANDGGPSADPVFVFGSNLRGVHGAGAALFAHQWRGAVFGDTEGLTGNAYAIPTKDQQLKTLPLAAIRASVTKFLEHAKSRPEESFEVTRVGCGLAGYKDIQIAPMFAGAPSNVDLPHLWRVLLGEVVPPNVIVAGSRSFTDQARMDASLSIILSRMNEPVIISGGAKGADTMGEAYALSHWMHRPVPFLRYPAEWGRYDKRAGMFRNQQMSRVATHLVAFWDGESPGTKAMIDTAKADGLMVRVVSAPRGNEHPHSTPGAGS
jgi:hypothetical protein